MYRVLRKLNIIKEVIVSGKTTRNNVNLCADGYKATTGSVVTDTCTNMSLNGLSKRYCKKVYQFTCTKDTSSTPPENPGGGTETPSVPAATLSKLRLYLTLL